MRLLAVALAAAFAVGLTASAAAQAPPLLTPVVLCVHPTPHGYWATFRYTSVGLQHKLVIPPAGLPPYPGVLPSSAPPPGENALLVGDTPVAPQRGAPEWIAGFSDRQVGGANLPSDVVVFSVWFPQGSSATWKLRVADGAERVATATAASPACPLYNGPWGDYGSPGFPFQAGYMRIEPAWPPGCAIVITPSGANAYYLRLPRSFRPGTKVRVSTLPSPATATPGFLLTGHHDRNGQLIDETNTLGPTRRLRLKTTPCGRFTLVVRAKGHKTLRRTVTRVPPPPSPWGSFQGLSW